MCMVELVRQYSISGRLHTFDVCTFTLVTVSESWDSVDQQNNEEHTFNETEQRAYPLTT